MGKQLQPEKRVRICERNSPADRSLGEELGEAAVALPAVEVPGRAEIHLQMQDCSLERVDA